MGRKNWPRVNKRKLSQKGTNTINQIFELNPIHIPNGCVGVDAAPLIEAAKAAAARRPGQELGPMVKFVVRVDGKWHECKNVQSLEKVLQGILPGSKCRVFRNACFGATVDFDIN
jgi:hypothetical protein